LFSRKISLATALPSDEFAIFMTRDVEIKGLAIPVLEAKALFKDYIATTIRAVGFYWKEFRLGGTARDRPCLSSL
jgi:hypothetical protein